MFNKSSLNRSVSLVTGSRSPENTKIPPCNNTHYYQYNMLSASGRTAFLSLSSADRFHHKNQHGKHSAQHRNACPVKMLPYHRPQDHAQRTTRKTEHHKRRINPIASFRMRGTHKILIGEIAC